MNILVSGCTSFLFRELLNSGSFNKNNLFDYREYNNIDPSVKIDRVLHFGSPSCKADFENETDTAISMIDYTLDLLKIAEKHNADFVFASSAGIYNCLNWNPDNITGQNRYELFKLAMEEYIQSFNVRTLILRIERVYSPRNPKCLVGRLMRNEIPEKDMDNPVCFQTVENFKKDFDNALSNFEKFDMKTLVVDFQYNMKCMKLRDVLPFFNQP